MRIDSQLTFVPLGGNQSFAGALGAAIPSVNIIDLLGVGVGIAPPNIIGNASVFGTDVGVGGDKQVIQVNLNAALAIASASGATLNIALQAAPDTGAAGGFVPGAWQTIGETGAMTLAQLQAAAVGALAQPIRLEWPPNFPANLNPRFVRLLFQVPAATQFDAGQIAAAFITRTRDDYSVKFQPRNYAVS